MDCFLHEKYKVSILLENIIVEKIKKEGLISFHDFMDMCLYYPEWGYYTSPGRKTGRNGDFYTSPEFTFLFGELIAKQIEEMWIVMSKPHFTIVEYGAGNGQLCLDILSVLERNTNLYKDLHYCIIEKNSYFENELQQKYPGKISFHKSINELDGFAGCVLTNEVIDNFPIHLVEMHDELMEVFVNYKNEFIEELKPASEELKNYLAEPGIDLLAGYRTELNLDIEKWLREIDQAMDRGYILTIDYGYPAQEYYKPERNKGTLLCFHQHKINESPYINIGKQDITSHVDFSGIRRWGEKNQLQYGGFTDQLSFLRGLGLTAHIRVLETKIKNRNIDKTKLLRMINTFLMDMGSKFKVLLMQKNTPSRKLAGMQFELFR